MARKAEKQVMTHDLFGRFVGLTLQNKVQIDRSLLLQYSLTPIPFSIATVDGSMASTVKSVLLNHLISNCTCTAEKFSNQIEIIDMMFYLNTLPKQLPETFGEFAEFLLKRLTKSATKAVHLIFYRYLQPSLKENEREKRWGAVSAGTT